MLKLIETFNYFNHKLIIERGYDFISFKGNMLTHL